jgi:peptidyl-prolyl cis-trans isomerase C
VISVNGTEVADRLGAVRELLRQRAVAVGLLALDAPEAAVEEAIERLLDQEVRTPEPTEEECRRYYEAHRTEFIAGELVFARHILFAVTAGVPVAALRRKAEETLLELRTHPELFETRAKELSNCPSGQLGGALGQISRGESVPEFEQAVFAQATTGILPRLVNTRYGFHIVAVDGHVPGRLVPFEAVCGRIAQRLQQSVRAKALEQYVAVLAGQAEVVGVDLRAVATPLVQ